MRGKHAPASPASFYLSLARYVGTALGIVALVAGMGIALVKSGSPPPKPSAGKKATATHSPTTPFSPSPPPSPTPRPPSKVTVEVLNGIGIVGIAGRTEVRLEDAGYNVISIGDAPRTDRTVILYVSRGAKIDAQELLRRFTAFLRIRRATEAQSARLKVILGADFEEEEET